jgi:hypothetical protein
MGALTGIAIAVLGGIRWLLLAVGAGAVWLAAKARTTAERLRP